MDTLREQLADVQHAIWAHWMRYMFTCGQFGPDGTWHMPAFKAERWQRQMDTPYNELTDRERESDRHQADKVLTSIQPAVDAAIERAETAERQRVAFESWANTLESCGWHDAGECPFCKANDVRKSTDVLEPDVAKAVCYCGTCRRSWLETPAVRIVTVGSTVVLPADSGLKGKTHTGEGPL